MILLDTDTLTLYLAGQPRVIAKVRTAPDDLATTIVSRIEILRGRFDSVVKAADGNEVLRAQERLMIAERDLAKFVIVPFAAAAATEFDRLQALKKLRKIGRADLLIASIALAHRTVLVTRNLRHFGQVPGIVVENWAD